MKKKNPNNTSFKVMMLVIEDGDDVDFIPTYFFIDDYEEVKWGGEVSNFETLEKAKSYIQYLLDLNDEKIVGEMEDQDGK